jgi:(p)ppGpp synthase/HD superfamily hydrolase
MMDTILTDVQNFAAEAHKGQRRKYADEDYIFHPIRVSSICRNINASLPVLAAALLHDVVEDTDVNFTRLKIFLEQVMNESDAYTTFQLVKDLTDVYTYNNYPTLNRRQRKDKEYERLAFVQPDAQTIKYADIIDNCMDIAESGDDFAPKFLQECQQLLKKIRKGNATLYQQAQSMVEMGLQKTRALA